MATTVVQGFREFLTKLEITDIQATTVSERQQGVREVMNREFTVLEDFLTGSYRRKTLIVPLKEADVDIFVVLDNQYKRAGGQASILDRVRAILMEAYQRTTDISRDGQAVTITFNDFKVDVVPAFYRTALFIRSGYYIPNTFTRSWIATDPQKHINLWTKRNNAQNGRLMPLIKMIKAWNQVNGKLLTSFHLECLILEIMKYETITNFLSAIRIVFEKARGTFQGIEDPVMLSSVSGYLTQGRIATVARDLEVAYTRAKTAEELVKKGIIEDAYYFCGQLFGDYFPTYG